MIIASAHVVHDKSETLDREHGFPNWTLGMLLAGSSRIGLGKNQYKVSAPNMGLIRPETPYTVAYGGGKRWEETWVFFWPRPGWEPLLKWPEMGPGYMRRCFSDMAEQRPYRDLFLEIVRTCKSGGPLQQELAMNLLERFLLLVAQRFSVDAAIGDNDRLRQAARILEESYPEQLSVAEIAAQVHMSESNFAHLFRKQFGVGPMRYRDRLRIEQAKALLLGTGRSVLSIAIEVGYDNASHFSTRFRVFAGMSPVQFRKTGGKR